MKLQGQTEFPYDPATVWALLHDVDVLVKTIPGCKSMVADGEDSYIIALSLGVASIKGDYTGNIRVVDGEYPKNYVLHAEGSGSPGYVKMSIDCRLEPAAAGTLLHWSSDTEVGGLIASIGGRVLTGISKFMAQQFFKTLKGEMAQRVEPGAAAAAKG